MMMPGMLLMADVIGSMLMVMVPIVFGWVLLVPFPDLADWVNQAWPEDALMDLFGAILGGTPAPCDALLLGLLRPLARVRALTSRGPPWPLCAWIPADPRREARARTPQRPRRPLLVAIYVMTPASMARLALAMLFPRRRRRASTEPTSPAPQLIPLMLDRPLLLAVCAIVLAEGPRPRP